MIKGAAFILFFLFASPAAAASVAVVSPAGGECWRGGSLQNILWTSDSTLGSAAVQYVLGNASPSHSSYNISPQASSPGTAHTTPWTLPNFTSSAAKVWVTGFDSADPSTSHITAEGSSPGPFSLYASPPAVPILAISSQSSKSITLGWTTPGFPGCNKGAHYQVVRDTVPLTIVDPTTTSYTDTTVTAKSTYSYRVIADDGLVTTSSLPISATAEDSAASPSPSPSIAPSPSPLPTATPQASPSPFIAATPKLSPKLFHTQEVAPSPSPAPEVTIKTISVGGIEISGVGHEITPQDFFQAVREDFQLSGTTAANAAVIVTLHSTPMAFTTVADSSGSWNLLISKNVLLDLEDGSHFLTVASRDSAGNLGAEKEIMRFSLVPAPRPPQSFTAPTALQRLHFFLWWLASFLFLSYLYVVGGRWYRQGMFRRFLPRKIS